MEMSPASTDLLTEGEIGPSTSFDGEQEHLSIDVVWGNNAHLGHQYLHLIEFLWSEFHIESPAN